MATFWFSGQYFDGGVANSPWDLDNGEIFDSSRRSESVGYLGAELDNGHEIVIVNEAKSFGVLCAEAPARPGQDEFFTVRFYSDLEAGACVDLLPLIPEKFHNSQLLLDYIEQIGCTVGRWHRKIAEVRDLLNPDLVPVKFVEPLAKQLGFEIERSGSDDDSLLRRQLNIIIDWYRIKGTYHSFRAVLWSLGLRGRVYDLWTNDYVTFVPQLAADENTWFYGKSAGEAPEGLAANSYKSPHFALEVNLDQCYKSTVGDQVVDVLSDSKLWDRVIKRIDDIRPVHTVPHFEGRLDIKVDTCCRVIESGCGVLAVGSMDCVGDRVFFDQGENFDDGKNFNTNTGSCTDQISSFIVGTGNADVVPDCDTFAIAAAVATGSVTSQRATDGQSVSYTAYLGPETEVAGLRELRMQSEDGTFLINATFPPVTKPRGVALKIVVLVSLYPCECVSMEPPVALSPCCEPLSAPETVLYQ